MVSAAGRQTAPRISLCYAMRNNRKAAAPTQEQRFDALADREMARLMMNCIERKIARGTERSCRLNTA